MSRSRSFVAAQAIQEFVTLHEWQIGEIRKAIAEADRGDFATDRQVRHSLKRLPKISDSQLQPLKGQLKLNDLWHR
jgi:predicted transcriptional regulator